MALLRLGHHFSLGLLAPRYPPLIRWLGPKWWIRCELQLWRYERHGKVTNGFLSWDVFTYTEHI
jgi:hypothetical protein